MLDYDLLVEYCPGEEKIYMPISECSKLKLRMTKAVQHYVNYVVTCSTPKAVTRDQVKGATDVDPALQALKRCINQGWIDAKTQKYIQVFHELSIADGIFLREDWIVVPEKLRHLMVEIAHEGHQGQVRRKQLLGAHVWFPGMDLQCDKFVSMCIACQANTPQTHHEPLKMTDLPEGLRDKISVDFRGPMAGGDLAVVFCCQYARYPVVEFVGSTSEKATIPIFRRVFDTYGVPKEIKSDNRPSFNSHKFEEYTQEEGFNHWKLTLGWAEANVERFMQRIKKMAQIAVLEGKPVRDEVHRGIRAYRATEHGTTGASPNKLMF